MFVEICVVGLFDNVGVVVVVFLIIGGCLSGKVEK
jgi:hypothetical protein